MKPISSCFCLSLQATVKGVCKSFLLLIAITTSVNIYSLDYKGPREESAVALGVVGLFLVLLLASAFAGHSGANEGHLYRVLLSLGLLCCAVVQWFVVGIISMQTSDPLSSWYVCLQNRCAETLWTTDFGYRLHIEKVEEKERINQKRADNFETKVISRDLSNLSVNNIIKQKGMITFTQSNYITEEAEEEEEDDDDEKGDSYEYESLESQQDTFFEEKNAQTPPKQSTVDVWDESPEELLNSPDQSTGMSLVLTLVFFMLFFVYFMACVTVICSLSAELHDEYRHHVYNEDLNKYQQKENV